MPIPEFSTRELVDAAREWAMDCHWQEEPQEIQEMLPGEILYGVERHYEGGLSEFMKNTGLDERNAA